MDGVQELRLKIDVVRHGSNEVISGDHWDSTRQLVVVEFSPQSSPAQRASAREQLLRLVGSEAGRITFSVTAVSTAEGERLAGAIVRQSIDEEGRPRDEDELNRRAIIGASFDREHGVVRVTTGWEDTAAARRKAMSVPNPTGIDIVAVRGSIHAQARSGNAG